VEREQRKCNNLERKGCASGGVMRVEKVMSRDGE